MIENIKNDIIFTPTLADLHITHAGGRSMWRLFSLDMQCSNLGFNYGLHRDYSPTFVLIIRSLIIIKLVFTFGDAVFKVRFPRDLVQTFKNDLNLIFFHIFRNNAFLFCPRSILFQNLSHSPRNSNRWLATILLVKNSIRFVDLESVSKWDCNSAVDHCFLEIWATLFSQKWCSTVCLILYNNHLLIWPGSWNNHMLMAIICNPLNC